ncbi:MAG TPA: mercury methylation corrinoid protein HgcA [Spirochaetota bacterium]|nr:mercury methylation corrinoid protein HgcA [Spirochaetota bacterium]
MKTDASFISGYMNTGNQSIPIIKSQLSPRDHLGSVAVRLGYSRGNYMVEPGLYALGKPGAFSPVIVTANYKLTVDIVRRDLNRQNLWILVIDTAGINVWCAAGKGTFGTQNIAKWILKSGLNDIVKHRRLILPQLGATGVAAHTLQKQTGWIIQYGPVRSRDLPAFLKGEETPPMRTVSFNFFERLILIPVEIYTGLKFMLITLSATFFYEVLLYLVRGKFHFTTIASVMVGFIAGTIFVPLLLPVLPSRYFFVKGFFAAVSLWIPFVLMLNPDLFTAISSLFIAGSISSFLAFNFTGATTFTSLAGVRYEIRAALPFAMVLMISGLITIFFVRS